MSIVYIKTHNENIYDIITDSNNTEKPEVKEKSSPRKGYPTALKTIPKRTEAGVSAKFDDLKKKPQHFERTECLLPARRNPVPKRDAVLKEQDEKLVHTPSNVIKRNIKYVENLKPDVERLTLQRRLLSHYVPFDAELSPKVINTAQYGRLPQWVKDITKQRKEQKDQQTQQQGLVQAKCRYLIRKHRTNLLNGLKANWRELQASYSTLPLLTDTVPKIAQKSRMEKQLAQLEKDIVFIERHHFLYIYKDEEE